MAGTPIGDVSVWITGDFSDLQTQIAAATAEAKAGAQEIASAFNAIQSEFGDISAGVGAATGQFRLFDESIQALGADISGQIPLFSTYGNAIEAVAVSLQSAGGAAASASAQFALFGPASTSMSELGSQTSLFNTEMQNMAIVSREVGQGVKSVTAETAALTPAIQSSTSAFGGMALQMVELTALFLALKELLVDTVIEFGKIQSAGFALKAITGDAEGSVKALENVKRLADELGFSMQGLITYQQKLSALQVPLAQIPRTLEAIADGAKAMLIPFEQAALSFDLLVDTGNIAGRSLVRLGLTIEDVGKAMNMADEPTANIRKQFMALATTADRAAVLSTALMEKFPEQARIAAAGVEGAWNRIKNAVTSALQTIGEATDGMRGLTDVIGGLIKGIETAVLILIGSLKVLADTAIASLMPLVEVFTGLGKAMKDAFTGDLSKASDDIKTALTRAGSYMHDFTGNVQKDWNDTTSAITKIWGDAASSIGKTSGDMALHFKAPADALAKFNESFQTSVQKALDAARDYEAGTATLSSAQTALNSLMEQASLKWDKLSEASKGLVQALIPLTNQLNELGKQTGIDKLMEQVGKLGEDFPKQFADLDSAILDTLNSFRTMDGTLANLKGAKEFLDVLKDYLVKTKGLEDSQRQLTSTMEQGEKAVIHFGGEMVKAFDGGNESAQRLAQKIKILGEQTGLTGQEIISAFNKIHQVGAQTIQDMEVYVQKWDDAVKAVQRLNQPMAIQLAAIRGQAQAQLALNEAIGAEADVNLRLAQTITAISLAQFALHQQTMGQADLWKQITTDALKEFDQLGQSLAQAWFAGETGAKALMNTLKKLGEQIVGDLVQGALKDLAASLIKNSGLMQSLGVTSVETVKTATDAIATTTSTASKSITQIATQAVSSISSLVSLVSSVIGAITGIIGNIEMAHMEKTLGQIETNTRQIFNAVGAGSQSVAGTSLASSQFLADIRDTIQGAVVTLLVDISSNLDDMKISLNALTAMGISGGGSGGTGDLAALLKTIADLQGALQVLNEQVNGAYGLGGGLLKDVNTALAAQLATQQAIVAEDQKQLDLITQQFNKGLATKAQVDAAAQQLKAAQDALDKIIATAQAQPNPTGASTGTTYTGPSGSAAVDYSGINAGTPTPIPMFVPTVMETLLANIASTAADILEALVTEFGTSVQATHARAISDAMSGFLNIPLDLLAKVATGFPNLMATLNGTAQNLGQATQSLTTATNGAATASQTLATASTSVAATLGSTATAIATVSNAILGISSVLEPLVLGKQQMLLAAQLPTGTGPNTAVSSVGGSALGSQVNLTINIPGTIVGPGGIDGVTTAVADQLVNKLATKGIRLTRG